MIVMKFGGTSVATASALLSVHDIICNSIANANRVVVVLSATSGTTSSLLALAKDCANGIDVAQACSEIIKRHVDLANELLGERSGLAVSDVEELGRMLVRYVAGIQLLGECTNQSLDMIASFGERFTTTILSHALITNGTPAMLFDACSAIRTNDAFHQAVVDMPTTKLLCEELLLPLFNSVPVVVTQGYIGGTSEGAVTTLGRGGSDYSASIFGACTQASEIQIWTDVSGVYSSDPRLVPDAAPIPSLSFNEVRELALYGAKVLHPDTIAPAIEAGIPVKVLNTFKPNDAGTTITAEESVHADIHALSVVQDCALLRGPLAQMSNLLRAGNMKEKLLLEMHSIEHAVAVLRSSNNESDIEIEVAMAGTKIQKSESAIVIATGPGVTSPKVLSRVNDACQGYDVQAVASGISTLSVFVICRKSDAQNILQKLHAIRSN